MRRSNGKGPLRFGGPIPAIEQAIVLHERGRLDEAARMYETILKADPNASVALRNLGAIRIQEGKPDDAQRLLRKAVNREPGRPTRITILASRCRCWVGMRRRSAATKRS